MDRVNMSIAILPMANEFAWDSATVGLVQSSFFWGYLLTQVAGGILADKIGGKKVLGFGVIWWSLATCATPFAAKLGLPYLFAARACMGVGEGVAMPAMNSMISRWVPKQERSRSLALVYSGMYAGSVAGLALSPHIVDSYGWPSIFVGFGALGFGWYLLWACLASSGPLEDERITAGERAYILQGAASQKPVTNAPWGQILSRKEVWAIILCHFCHNWGTFILLTWMPTYYHDELGMDLTESGLYSVLPWITMALAANAGGWLADDLVGRGWSVTAVRKTFQTLGFLGPAYCLSQLSHVSPDAPLDAVGLLMASQGLDALSQSGLYSNHQDIAPRYAGILLGMSNTAGVLAGVLGTFATGYILSHGDGGWDQVWEVAIALYLVGALIWNTLSSGEQVID